MAMAKVYSTIGSGTISGCCQSESHQNDSSDYNREDNQGIIPFLHWQQSITPCSWEEGQVKMKVIETSN
jgi:hypothetical protein